MAENKVQTFYEREAEIYDDTRFKSSHGKFADFVQQSAVLELIGNCKGKRVLEIGSGTGRFTKELVKRGANVVCVDLSRPMHERSKKAIVDGNVQYFVMSGLDLAFDDSSFDCCLTVNMMSHIKDDKKLFSEVFRVLKRKGCFIANFPNLSSMYFPIGGLVNLFERSIQVPVYSRWYSINDVINSLKYSGLNPVKTYGRMIIPKKYCPHPLLMCLKVINSKSSDYLFLSGDLFVQSIRT